MSGPTTNGLTRPSIPVTLWMKDDVLAPSHYVVSLAALGFVLGLLLWLRQRGQRQLSAQMV